MATKAVEKSQTQDLMRELVKEKPDYRRIREQARSLGLPENLPLESLMAMALEMATTSKPRRKSRRDMEVAT